MPALGVPRCSRGQTARECLYLLPSVTPDIAAERELLEATKLLHQLGGTHPLALPHLNTASVGLWHNP